MNTREISRRLCKDSFIATAVLIALAFLAPGALRAAEEPGDTDWLGASQSMVFRDDEYAFGMLDVGAAANGSAVMELEYPTKDDLTGWTYKGSKRFTLPADGAGGYSRPERSRHLAAASGRISDPLHDGLAAAWYTKDGTLRVESRRLDDGSFSVLHSVHVNGTTTLQRTVDVAVGDLDKLVDADGYYHDEIVVARTANTLGSAVNVQIDVLDYNLNVLASSSLQGPLGTAATLGAVSVACAIGDFDGDHAFELAVAVHWADNRVWQLDLFRLVRAEGTGSVSLAHLASRSASFTPGWGGSGPFPLDIAAGDFAGSGKDQIVLALADSWDGGEYWIHELDANLALQQKAHGTFAGTCFAYVCWVRSLRVAAGIFKYDPENGWDVDRRQIALSWDVSHAEDDAAGIVESQIVFVDSQYGLTHGPVHGEDTSEPMGYFGDSTRDMDMAVGNFVGHGVNLDQTSPTMQLALHFTCVDNWGNARSQETRVLGVGSDGTIALKRYYGYSYSKDPGIPFIAAVDYDGDSWRLGAPMQITLDQFPKLDAIVQEPPKHVDYLPVDPHQPQGAWDVFNVGGYSEFKVKTAQTDGNELKTTIQSNSSWENGGAGSADFSLCLTMQKDCEKEPTFDASLKVALEGKREHSESTINTWYSEAHTRYTDSAALDDNLTGKLEAVDIWRYPIVGYETPPPESIQGFYEVVIPTATQSAFIGAGMDHADFYQPLHENHNLLSYPQLHLAGGGNWVPSDLGSFTIPDPDHPEDPDAHKTLTVVMNWPNQQMTVYYWDGNPLTWEMDFSTETGEETEKTHQNSLSESVDVAFGLHGYVSYGEKDIGNLGLEFTANFNHNNTWGGSTIGETKDSNAKGLAIEKPAGEGADKAYAFASAVYVAQDGTFKVSHATDPKGATQGADWWQAQYGRKRDPALNLPYRFEWHKPYGEHLEEWWTMRPLDDPLRKRMRGFFLRNNIPDPISGKYEYFAGSPVDGEIVQLCARVYNYSFVDVPVFKARFYYQPWNSQLAEPAGDAISQPNMVVDVPTLDSALKTGGTTMREVCVPWDTTGLSQTGNSSITYRFIVKLDPENAIDELHESWDAQGNEIAGGNNEGFWPWNDGISVSAAQQRAGAAVGARAVLSLPKRDVVAVKTAKGIEPGEGVRLTAGKLYRIRFRSLSDRHERKSRLILFYDGNPKEGGKAVASRVLHGVAEGDNYHWVDWVPKETGTHEIWLQALQAPGIPDSESSWASLRVNVQEAEERQVPQWSAADEGGDGCSASGSRSKSGGGVLLIALTLVLIAERWSRGERR